MNNIVTWPYWLRKGHSNDPSKGACALAAINWLVYGTHSDKSVHVCPIIAQYVITGNDKMPDDIRQRLLPYLWRIADSRSFEHQNERLRILMLGMARVFVPIGLDAAGLSKQAAALRETPDTASIFEIKNVMETTAKVVTAWKAHRKLWRHTIMATGMISVIMALLAIVLTSSLAASFLPVLMVGTLLTAFAVAVAAENAALAAERSASVVWLAVKALKLEEIGKKAVEVVLAVDETWDAYFIVLDAMLVAGPQGEPWSADFVATGVERYRMAGGLVTA